MKKKKNILPENENPFKTPEGYFGGFSERMMERIDAENAALEDDSPAGIMRYLRPALIMAASFAAIFLIIFIPVKTIGPQLSSNNYLNDNDNVLLDYLHINERTIIEAFELDTAQIKYNNALVEEYLMTSISEYDLVENKN
ncbi:MAG: hypothetical protein K9G70_14675 [Prolixibacteraceae bacterium]|nr:hypothetical protein [Prolixibacteraceae bacterium]